MISQMPLPTLQESSAPATLELVITRDIVVAVWTMCPEAVSPVIVTLVGTLPEIVPPVQVMNGYVPTGIAVPLILIVGVAAKSILPLT